jgi:ribosomal protein S18 acetylase RimI-like enzyme
MTACFDAARARGCDAVWLQVWKDAPWAVGFYRKMGFEVVGSASFYFGEQVGDDYVMERKL